MDHLQRVKQEFTRQAGAFASSPAITDAQLTRRFSEAVGSNGHGIILDVACGPGIVSAALAEKAREVAALDVTPEMLSQAWKRCAKAGFTWDKDRALDEWMGIVNDPARAAPLRTVVRALAAAGATAGMGLSLAGEIVLFHRWLLIAARKRRS